MEAKKTLRVATLPISNRPGFYQNTKGITHFTGITEWFMTIVLIALSQSYEVVRPADGEYGFLQPDGNYSGMVGMVQKGEADLAINFLRMSTQRLQPVGFSRSYTMDGLNFVSKKPGKHRTHLCLHLPFRCPHLGRYLDFPVRHILHGQGPRQEFHLGK